MADNQWKIHGMSLSCLNDTDTYVTHILGHIMCHIHIRTYISISFVSLRFPRDHPGLDAIVLPQSFLVLDDSFSHFTLLHPLFSQLNKLSIIST
jgi:hypothetical protein